MSALYDNETCKKFDPIGKSIAVKYFESLGYISIKEKNDLGIDLIFVRDYDDIIYVDAAVRSWFDFPLQRMDEYKPRWRGGIHIVERKAKYHKWYHGDAYVFEISSDLSEAFLINCGHLTKDKLSLVSNVRHPEGELMYTVHYRRAIYCKL